MVVSHGGGVRLVGVVRCRPPLTEEALLLQDPAREAVPLTSLAEIAVADLLPIGAAQVDAERLRDAVPLWFHTFQLCPGVYTPGIARDHRYRVPALGRERFAGRSVLDIGTFDGFYAYLAEAQGASRVVGVDNEQYVDWIRGRFGIELEASAGFRAIGELLGSRVAYEQIDALEVGRLDEAFDVVLCFGMLHRVHDPVGMLRALAAVLEPGGELVLETYGSRLAQDSGAVEVRESGDVYGGDEFTYWGFPAEGLRRLGRLAGLDEMDVVDRVEVDGHPRIIAVLRKTA